jgi:ribosomal protein S18 acetylase RimI-like enzyme
MRRDLAVPVAPAPWPAGLTRIPFGPGIAPSCRALMNVVYAEDFGDEVPFERWWPWVSGDADYDPAMMFVAADGERVVGFCHGWRAPFIKDLVVAADWRGRGLGAALLTSALNGYAARGDTSVDLKTDVDNQRAQSLYTRLGFVIVERVDPA